MLLLVAPLVDGSFMFLLYSRQAVEKGMHVWAQFSLALRLHGKWSKQRLMSWILCNSKRPLRYTCMNLLNIEVRNY